MKKNRTWIESQKWLSPRPSAVRTTLFVTAMSVVAAFLSRDAQAQRIVYSHGPGWLIKTINADGTGLTSLPNGNRPLPSPDGSKIAFVSEDLSPKGLYVVNADGSNLVNLVEDFILPILQLDGAMAWSPDSNRLALTMRSPVTNHHDLYVVDVANPLPPLLVATADDPWAMAIHPTWSQDGSQIAFWHRHRPPDDSVADEVRVVNSDGSSATSTLLATDASLPDWSGGNNRIAYQRQHYMFGIPIDIEIWAMDPDGSNKVNLSNSPDGDDIEPHWSPGGTRIAFLSTRPSSATQHVFVMNSDGSNPTVVSTEPSNIIGRAFGRDVVGVHSGGNLSPKRWQNSRVWTADGTRIVYRQSLDLYIANADGTGSAYLTPGWTASFIPSNNTPPGMDVSVQPIDAISGDTPVTVTFDDVTVDGHTTLETSTAGPPPPPNFRILNTGGQPLYYNISTTAQFSGDIEVCIEYGNISPPNPSSLSLWHHDGTGWTELLGTNDTTAMVICGTVSSLSPFALMIPEAGTTLLTSPTDFSGSETVIDFEDAVYPYTHLYTSRGVTLRTTEGSSPGTGTTAAVRQYGPAGDRMLHNAPPGWQVPHPDLEMTFGKPMNRVGFEIRNNNDDDLILSIACVCDGEVIDSHTINTNVAFQFVGLESTESFDKVVVNVDGPVNGFFHLDNLRFEPFGGGVLNDSCAEPFDVPEGRLAFSTVGATTDGPAHPACAVDGDGGVTVQDVWFRHTALCDGILTVTTCEQLAGDATYDTDIVVYDGDDCGALNVLGCNDDDHEPGHTCGNFPDWHSSVHVPVTRGESYLIRVGGWATAGDQGTGHLIVSCAPNNDSCATPAPINEGLTTYSTFGATTDGTGDATCQWDGQIYNDIWFVYEPECNGELLLSTCVQLGAGSDYDTDLAVYEGSDCTTAALIGCNDDDLENTCGVEPPWQSTLSVNVVGGQEYLVRVGGFGPNDRGNGELSLELTAADTDGDGLDDCEELSLYGTNPFLADTDGDLLSDGDEVLTYGTNPLNGDTDGDGLGDGEEVALAAFGGCPDPLVPDSDGDGLTDGAEVDSGLDPCDSDTDADGLADGLEGTFGTSATDPDSDDDGLLDGTEVDMAEGSGCPDPTVADSDGDTLEDGDEVMNVGTDPCNTDSDGDGVADNEDPLPTEPGVTSGFIEDALRSLCDFLDATPLEDFDAPNNNAAKGRRNAMCNKLRAVANLVADEAWQEAIDTVEDDLLPKVDGAPSPQDWLHDGVVKNTVRDELELLVFLMSLEL